MICSFFGAEPESEIRFSEFGFNFSLEFTENPKKKIPKKNKQPIHFFVF